MTLCLIITCSNKVNDNNMNNKIILTLIFLYVQGTTLSTLHMLYCYIPSLKQPRMDEVPLLLSFLHTSEKETREGQYIEHLPQLNQFIYALRHTRKLSEITHKFFKYTVLFSLQCFIVVGIYTYFFYISKKRISKLENTSAIPTQHRLIINTHLHMHFIDFKDVIFRILPNFHFAHI